MENNHCDDSGFSGQGCSFESGTVLSLRYSDELTRLPEVMRCAPSFLVTGFLTKVDVQHEISWLSSLLSWNHNGGCNHLIRCLVEGGEARGRLYLLFVTF